MGSENNGKKPEEVRAVEEWINGFVVPIAAAVAAIPGLSPEERAVVLDHALRFQRAAPGPAAEQKPKEALAPQGMDPLKPDIGQNDDAALSRALTALEWQPAKNGKGEWVFILDREGKVEDAFARTPLQEFLERVKAAPSETGLVFGGYRYRVNERFLHRWPLRH